MYRNWKQKFQFYMNRERFDYMNKEIDPVEYHAPFVKMATILGVIETENKLLRYIIPGVSLITAALTATVLSISLVHFTNVRDIKGITESLTYFLAACYEILIMTSIIKGNKNYHKLLKALNDDFYYISTQQRTYRKKFFDNQLLTFKASIIVVFVTVFNATAMNLSIWAVFALSVIKKDSGMTKPLPFPYWFGDCELTLSPIYELLLFFSSISVSFFSIIYSFMLQSYVVWIRVITTRADIIVWNLRDLLNDITPAKNSEERMYNDALIKQRMRPIIEMHQAMLGVMNDYASVFRTTLFYEQMIAAPIICMTAYCFAEKLDQGKVELQLIILCVGSIEVAFIPNFLCTHLLEKVHSIVDSWDIPFWNAGPVIRPYLVLIMQRSLRPLPLVTHGFADISLETYANVITRAYSCFNMLRQTNINVT